MNRDAAIGIFTENGERKAIETIVKCANFQVRATRYTLGKLPQLFRDL